jgi:hypothetical protein
MTLKLLTFLCVLKHTQEHFYFTRLQNAENLTSI